MEILVHLITIVLITKYAFVMEVQPQRSGIGFLQAAIDSVTAMPKSDAIGNSAEAYLRKLIPPTTEEHLNSVSAKQTDSIPAESDGGIFSSITDALKEIRLPDMDSIISSINGSSIIIPTKPAQSYLEDMIKPIQKSGADIVEGAVKTGVDQAMNSITDGFKIDVVLVVAVLVIQVILFVCGAHLCLLVYQREKEIQSYVKQQINLTRTP